MLKQIEGLNKNAYLINFDNWNQDFAIEMAVEDNLDFTDCHWVVINFFRDYFSVYSITP